MYYADPIAWAVANGIVTGYTDEVFGPNDAITRQQMAAILYRYAEYKGYDVSESADLSGYTDSGDVSAYAEEAMAVVDDIVREPVPLIDQLEGVDTQRQREILQEYSARQIAALDHVVGTIRGLNETE